jgi:hypothetical protein
LFEYIYLVIIEMAESGVIKTVVVKNGISYNVSVQRASVAPASNVVPVTSSPAAAALAVNTAAAANAVATNAVAANAVATNAVAANAVAANAVAANTTATPAFVAPIVAFMNHIQQNYNELDMTEDKISKEISELKVKDGRRLVNTNSTVRDKALQKKIELGRTTFAEFIKKIIANEQNRIEKRAQSALATHREQQNTSQLESIQSDVAEKEAAYNAAFAAENALYL